MLIQYMDEYFNSVTKQVFLFCCCHILSAVSSCYDSTKNLCRKISCISSCLICFHYSEINIICVLNKYSLQTHGRSNIDEIKITQ
jgi:hypothetical protein